MACRRSSCPNYHPHAEELCDPCDEFETQQHRELYGRFCLHCKSTMLPAAFEQHKWQVYYRTGERPRSRRVRL